MTKTEEQVILLWNKGLNNLEIAYELGLDEEVVNDIIECEGNYQPMISFGYVDK